MDFSRKKVLEVAASIAPKYEFEPTLIQAICLQEGGKNKDGSFAPDRARLEQGYYIRYVENKFEYATTSEILLSASYGVMQMMGLSLKELNYFEWYYGQATDTMKKILGDAYSQFAVPSAIDAYCVNLIWQIEWGCKWLSKKRSIAKGDIIKTLSLWNGDMTGKYANEVLTKQKGLK